MTLQAGDQVRPNTQLVHNANVEFAAECAAEKIFNMCEEHMRMRVDSRKLQEKRRRAAALQETVNSKRRTAKRAVNRKS